MDMRALSPAQDLAMDVWVLGGVLKSFSKQTILMFSD